MSITIEEIKRKIEEKKLSQGEFENFVSKCESETDYECILSCAIEAGIQLEDKEEKVMKKPVGDGYYSEEIVEQYFHEIGLYDPIKKEEEEEVVRKAQGGDEEARERLVTSNLRLVAKVAMKYSKSGTNYIDLIQEGTIGLIKAIDKYDFEKGHSFSSYAVWWIKRDIINSIANRINTIKIPNYIYLQNRKIKLFEIEFLDKNNRKPTYEEIAEGLELEVDEVKKLKEASEIGVSGMGEGSETYLGDYNTVEKIDSELNLLEERSRVSNLLKKVSVMERKVIEMYYGLGEDGKCSLKEIANELEISVDKVKLIRERALTKLKYAGERLWI
ncbi:hypothetical protein PM10SUCC1_33660 [Propionigenium maris DSM 9537]|uniref:RNA polymerase sigma-70 domain-containing protein n=1 Tax=Propionigenium maris DSM 9537 TaxID=1123000 RepID=A0A9W6GQ08_9FUSO|nr:sigma-70 family RNA polymerase sigma factor [Propionigenium maris]GLI57852.1 hypothetical protein PM10SUCC1_33660 [Propionigenium maris DSM 9537]